MDEGQVRKDWTFEVGYDASGAPVVDAYSSAAITDRRMHLTRSQLLALRAQVDRALHNYPTPARPAK